jgi:hypothetical protein
VGGGAGAGALGGKAGAGGFGVEVGLGVALGAERAGDGVVALAGDQEVLGRELVMTSQRRWRAC